MDLQEQFDQADPEVRSRIRASFDRQGLMRHLGAQLGHIDAGATSAIADSAGGYAEQ